MEMTATSNVDSPRKVSFEVSAAAPAFSFEPTPTESTTFGQDTDNVFNDESDDDDEDDEEARLEERENAVNAFDSVDTADAGEIDVADFPKIFEALGTVYSEDEHARTIQKLANDGRIAKTDFVEWYLHWIFDEAASESD
ncbi:hypothetical protein SDRG_17351, partial [Saprolegnia diclina VS20]